MVFDGPGGSVSRYMCRIDVEGIPKDELNKPHAEGICFNNLLFNEVDGYLAYSEKFKDGSYELFGTKNEEGGGPLFTTKLMMEEIFSHKNGRFRDWWYASLYKDYLVFYSPFKIEGKVSKPVKAWKCYEQAWEKE